MNTAAKAIHEKVKSEPDAITTSDAPVILESAILSILNAERPEISLSDLLRRLTEQGLKDEAATKSTIARLLAGGEIDMTRLRRLRTNEEPHAVEKSGEEAQDKNDQTSPGKSLQKAAGAGV